MTGRSVPTWVGKTPDSAIPARVKARIYLRCEGKCALTGRKLRVGDPYDFDHIIQSRGFQPGRNAGFAERGKA